MRHFITAFVFVFSVTSAFFAQTPTRPALIRDFLDLPAPRPTDDGRNGFSKPIVEPTPIRDRSRVPPDDAPIGEMVVFWSEIGRTFQPLRYSPTPSAVTVERLQDFCAENPNAIVSLVSILPADAKTIQFAKAFSDGTTDDLETSYSAVLMRKWLRLNSDLYADELLRKVEAVKDAEGYVTNQEELLALAKVDWERALPHLERLIADKSQPVSSTLAKWAFYARSIRKKDENDVTKYRRMLQDVVENREMPPGARDLALDAIVAEGDWTGRDEWYLSLLSDETLHELKVGESTMTGLTTLLLNSPPEKYAKMMAALVAGGNPTIRTAAARNLVELIDERNEDAVTALLPWLSDPNWLTEQENERRLLIEAAGELKMPAAFNALMTIVTTEPKLRAVAVAALAKYGDPRAIPALKAAWASDPSFDEGLEIVRAIEACGGFTAQERMDGIEEWILMMSTTEGRALLNREYAPIENGGVTKAGVPMSLMLGRLHGFDRDPGDETAALAIARLKTLLETKPVAAEILTTMMRRWNNRTMYAERLRQVRSGEADIPTLLNLLNQRPEVLEKVPTEIQSMRSAAGFPRGFAACLAEDESDLLAVVRQTDTDAIIAAFGCGRLLRAKLPVAEIGPMLGSPDQMLATAAERFLEVEDSVEARTLILARHPNKARILGAHLAFVPDEAKMINFDGIAPGWDPSAVYYNRGFRQKEEVLQKEILATPDLEAVFAIIRHAGAPQMIVRVYRDRVVFSDQDDAARYRERVLTKQEYDDFYRLIIDEKIDALPPQISLTGNSGISEFLMFGKNGGRRVFLSNVKLSSTPVGKIIQRMTEFDNGKMALRYRLAEKIQGLEVLFADKNFPVLGFRKDGEGIRLFVSDVAEQAAIQKRLNEEFAASAATMPDADEDDEEVGDSTYEQQMRRRREVEFDHLSWRNLSNGKLGKRVPAPPNAVMPESSRDLPEDLELARTPSWQVRSGTAEIQVTEPYSEDPGIYKTSPGAKPVILKKGEYTDPRTTFEGNWLFVSKESKSDSELKEIVRLNLRTGRELPVSIPAGNELKAVAYVASAKKMLVLRVREAQSPNRNIVERNVANTASKSASVGPPQAERQYYLVDPATGVAQRVTGDFRALEEQSQRPLQESSKPEELWAAIYDEKTGATSVGRYNTQTFSFVKTNEFPEIRFSSMDFQADETAGKLYLVYNGHFLSLPLAAAK